MISLSILLYVTSAVIIFRFMINVLWPWTKKRHELLRAVRDIDCVRRHWFWGHVRKFPMNEKGLKAVVDIMTRFPKCTQRWFGPMNFVLSSYHPHFAKTLLSTNEPKSNHFYRFFRPYIRDGLVVSHGQKWRRNRKLLTPAFHFDALKKYLSCTNAAAANMLEKWSQKMKNGVVTIEVSQEAGLVTLDNVLQCIYSKPAEKYHSAEVLEYLQVAKVLTEVVMDRIAKPYLGVDFIFYLTPTGRKYKHALKIAQSYTENAIRERKSEMEAESNAGIPHSKRDFLNILLTAKDENGRGLTFEEIREELDTFQSAGHDTTSSAISWGLYNLAKYPEYQEKCRKEIRSVLQGRNALEWEDLSKLTYLTMCLKESMRLYPPVMGVGRVLSKPVHFPRCFGSDQYIVDQNAQPATDASRTLPRDLSVNVDLYMLHRNPAIWDDPEKFDPERFTPENTAKRSPHSYLPFSSGPRNCIGKHFAMYVLKVVVATALNRFRFDIDHSCPKPILERRIFLHSSTGVHLKVSEL